MLCIHLVSSQQLAHQGFSKLLATIQTLSHGVEIEQVQQQLHQPFTDWLSPGCCALQQQYSGPIRHQQGSAPSQAQQQRQNSRLQWPNPKLSSSTNQQLPYRTRLTHRGRVGRSSAEVPHHTSHLEISITQAAFFSTTSAAVQHVAAAQTPPQRQQPHPHPNNSSSGTRLVQQAPPAPGTPPRPPAHKAPQEQQQQGRHLAARHLRQYLQSINSSSFVSDLAEGVRAGDRLAISRSLTLCESTRTDHSLQAAALLRKLIDDNQQHQQQQQLHHGRLQQQDGSSTSSPAPLLPPPAAAAAASAAGGPSPPPLLAAATQQQATTGTTSSSSSSSGVLRVGVSGPPGAGKSSLIETWGCYLADHGSKVAVLAVDPSSMESGGAILGDKTRMSRLSSHSNAYVRPSPARGTLGGVSRATFDAMLICEAAGYDRILVETVGVGQSEVAVADLVDCMMLVMPPVGGDDLQMIKRGIMEVADVVVVNKADGETEKAATRAASEYGGCLHLMPHRYRAWEPQSLAVSAHTGKGVPALARLITQFQQALTDSGELQRCRVQRAESVAWLSLEEQLLEGLRQDPHTRWLLGRLLPMVRAGTMAPRSAADIALAYFYQHCG